MVEEGDENLQEYREDTMLVQFRFGTNLPDMVHTSLCSSFHCYDTFLCHTEHIHRSIQYLLHQHHNFDIWHCQGRTFYQYRNQHMQLN